MFRAPLQGLSESKKFWAWTKCKDSRRATRFAQTISPSVLTSLPGTSRFTKTLPKSPCPHPPAPQKGSRNGACFLLYRLGKSSNDQLRKTKARQESLTMCKSFQPRCFAVFQVCLQNNQRQKQQKAEVREKPEGIVNSQGGSKVMLPPALIILHKNEESRSGSISFGNLHPSPDSSFLF